MRLVLGFLCAFSMAFAQDAGSIVGRWRSAETSKGGIGAMYDFGADGTVQFSPGAIVSSPYRVAGNQLTVGSSEPLAFTLQFEGDNRMRMTAFGTTEVLNRLGTKPNGASPLTGEWTTTRDMDGNKVLVHWIFGADSNALMMIRFKTDAGTYTLQNGRLVARFGGQVGLDGPVVFGNGTVEIHRSGGRVTKLVRY
ncbi:MAG: hypothetical protein ABL967_00480 [Bryobacteraceae bacterium]